jgi:hypothetical protein
VAAVTDLGYATCTDRPLEPVQVLVDADDDHAVTAALLDGHDPAAGRVVVHPTVGSSGAKALAHDVLVALGRPAGRLVADQVSGATPAWQAVIAWCAADAVSDVVVLRAHLLVEDRWEQLLELWRCTGVRLVLVCHTAVRAATAVAAHRLGDVPHVVTTDVAQVLRPRPAPVAVAAPVPEVLAPVPDSEFTRFRADAFRRLPRPEFDRVDTVYQQGLTAACRWLGEHPDLVLERPHAALYRKYPVFPAHLRPAEIAAGVRLLESSYPPDTLRSLAAGLLCVSRGPTSNLPVAWPDHTDLQLFLTDLVATSPSRRHTVTVLRGAQAGFLLHGVLLQIPDTISTTAVGPGLTGLPVTAAITARIRENVAGPVHAAALATLLFTGATVATVAQFLIGGLADDASSLHFVPPPGQWRTPPPVAYAVPPMVRPLLRAARTYWHLRGIGAERRLLYPGATAGALATYLNPAAAACQIPLPGQPATAGPWHAAAACSWVGRPLHSTDTEVPT